MQHTTAAGATAPASSRHTERDWITQIGLDAALRTALPAPADEMYARAKSAIAAWDISPMPAQMRQQPVEYVPRPRLRVSPIDPLIRRGDDCSPFGIPRPRSFPRRFQ